MEQIQKSNSDRSIDSILDKILQRMRLLEQYRQNLILQEQADCLSLEDKAILQKDAEEEEEEIKKKPLVAKKRRGRPPADPSLEGKNENSRVFLCDNSNCKGKNPFCLF